MFVAKRGRCYAEDASEARRWKWGRLSFRKRYILPPQLRFELSSLFQNPSLVTPRSRSTDFAEIILRSFISSFSNSHLVRSMNLCPWKLLHRWDNGSNRCYSQAAHLSTTARDPSRQPCVYTSGQLTSARIHASWDHRPLWASLGEVGSSIGKGGRYEQTWRCQTWGYKACWSREAENSSLEAGV